MGLRRAAFGNCHLMPGNGDTSVTVGIHTGPTEQTAPDAVGTEQRKLLHLGRTAARHASG